MPPKGYISTECQRIIGLHLNGLKPAQIEQELGCSRYKVYQTLERHGYCVNNRPKFDWTAIQAYYDEGNSMRGCLAKFKMSSKTLTLAVRKGLLKTRTLSDAVKIGIKLGKIKRPAMSEENRKKQSERAKCRGLGGETNYYKYQYKGINMDSRWEVDTAKWLDEHSIEWQRGKHLVFKWTDDAGETHRYYPDFYLPAYNVYLDPKNKYLVEKDRHKIETVIRTHSIRIIWGEKREVLDELINLIRANGEIQSH